LEVDGRVCPFRFYILLFLVVVVVHTFLDEGILVVEGRDVKVTAKLSLVLWNRLGLKDGYQWIVKVI
jgi:hypothetical protein